MNKDFIFISGAPGAGKSTISDSLRNKLNSPLIDFGNLRCFHLDEKWSNASIEEENMAFESLIFILKNYHKHGYTNVIINDLTDEKIKRIEKELSRYNYIIFSLTIKNDDELKKRVVERSNSGWKDFEKSIQVNKDIIERPLLTNEYKINNTHNQPEETVKKIVDILSQF